uniref:RING-type domain-containing protein n=1 Tax=Panagrellus redivivus TaxID=6233 RepID=A0A7E4VLA5_PANRE
MPDVIAESLGSASSSDTLADLGEDREEFVQLEMRTCDGGCRDVFTLDELTTFEGCRHAVCGLCLTEITIMESPSGTVLCPLGPCRHGNVSQNVHAKLEYMFLKQVQYDYVIAEIKDTYSDSSEISYLPSVTLSSEETGLSSVSSYLTSSELQSPLQVEGDFEGDPIDPEQSLVMSETMTEASDTSNDIFSTTETETVNSEAVTSEDDSETGTSDDSSEMETSVDSSTSSIADELLEKLEALSCATALGVPPVTEERTILLTSESLMSSVSN